ncbi:AIG2 family protein [Gloeothece citriformis PCC 7424]|uniref:AIG2 family protein n=1 Tax=Gloeothece citriformis (strain PCC 7424) TaxID=65393 RepID=B7KBS6_GLOC7|nr:gamma-glutamylcyclotransferase family protein [Gloeothece citriformis]ACK73054.1 AIG2 family protein [Gloeothece citriformis PCC 7424]
MNEGNYIWNFAYGSNMHPLKRLQRGEIKASETLPGVLDNWCLVFDLPGLKLLEPAMASISPQLGHQVHGVLLRLEPEEFEKLIRSEGGSEYYELIPCEVRTYDHQIIQALAFKTRPDKVTLHPLIPSKRYMTLIRQGAKLSQLDPQYCQWLDGLPHREASYLVSLLGSLLIEFLLFCNHRGWLKLSRTYMKLLRWCEAQLPLLVSTIAQGVLLLPALLMGIILRLLGRIGIQTQHLL